MAWRIHGERLLLLSWGRAVLLQLAHPLIAAGVGQHSQFGRGPRHDRARLFRTIHAMLALTFGDEATARQAATRINRIHDHVHGHLPAGVGQLATHTPYSAHMPDLLLWVHATMVDSSLVVYERYVSPLTPGERDRYCAESRAIGPALGLPTAMIPATRADLDRYMTRMLTTGVLAVDDSARRLARLVLTARPYPFVTGPLLSLLHLPTVGLLPPTLRSAYRLPWTPVHQIALTLGQRATRGLLPLLPAAVRYWPIARP